MKRYYITDRKALGGLQPLLEVIKAQIERNVDFIQIREKDLTARELYQFATAVIEARDLLLHTGIRTKILINTRADIAKASRADGVHLPSRAPRETLPGLIVGRSCHTVEDVQTLPADLITFGPVFATPYKGPAMGINALTEVRLAAKGKEVFALGGMTWENAASCIAAGATGIAGIRLFQEPALD